MTAPLTIVVVCAANICRSPAAAALLSSELASRGIDAHVSSAGVTAVGDRPACDLAQALVGRFATRRYEFEGGGDVHLPEGAHRSRRLTTDDLVTADLVIAMEEGQAAMVREMNPHVDVVRLELSGDIPDPHAIGYESHPAVFARLRAAVSATADRLAANQASSA